MRITRRQLRQLIREAYEDKLEDLMLTQHGKASDAKWATIDSLRDTGRGSQVDDTMENYDEHYLDVFRSLRGKGVTEDEIKAVVDYMLNKYDIPMVP